MSAAKNTYELTYIVNAVISDDQIKDLVNRVSSYISESGGEIIEIDEWGSRRLAFPIQKKRNGHYVNMYFRASGAVIARLERALEIDDNILRYLTLRMDAKMLRHYEKRKSAIVEARDEEKAEKPKHEASKDSKAEKPKKEEPKKDEAKEDQPKADKPKEDQPKADEAKADESQADEAKADESQADETKAKGGEEPADSTDNPEMEEADDAPAQESAETSEEDAESGSEENEKTAEA